MSANQWFFRVENWPEKARLAQFSPRLLASNLGVSPRQLQRAFRDVHGLTPAAWLNNLRLEEAAHLLEIQVSVKEVAFRLNFKDSSHFSHKFKARYGISPQNYVPSGSSPMTSSPYSVASSSSLPKPDPRPKPFLESAL